MTYVVLSKVSAEIITLAQAKAWLRVDFDDDDELISDLIDAAIDIAEKCMNRSLLTTTWESYRESFVEDLTLARGGFQSVESVEYLADDIYTVLATTEYTVRIGGIYGVICEIDPPNHDASCNAVKITFKAGFGDTADDIPAAIKTAIKNILLLLYENKGSCGVDFMPASSRVLLEKYRIVDLGVDRSNVCV